MKQLSTYLLLLFLLAACSTKAWAQSVADSAFLFAHHLRDKGEYKLALLEYQRYHVLPGTDPCKAAKGMASTWMQMGEHQMAAKAFEKAIGQCNSKPIETLSAHLNLIEACLLKGEYRLARYELDQLTEKSHTSKSQHRMDYLDLLICAHLQEFDSVTIRAKAIPTQSPYRSRVEQIINLSLQYQAHSDKSPSAAYWLSTLVPGSGQWYCGNRKQTTIAFSVVSILTGAFGWSVYRLATADTRTKRNIAAMDLLLFGTFVWHRYYDGSRKLAHYAAIVRNREAEHKFHDQLNQIR